jgi:hypothetical protein
MLGPLIAGSDGIGDQLAQHLLSLWKIAEAQVDLRKPLGQQRAPGVSGRQQSPGSRHEVLGRSHIEACNSTVGCAGQSLTGAQGQCGTCLFSRPRCATLLNRLLQVVADHLVGLGREADWILLQPIRVPLVQAGAVLSRHGLIRRRPDEHVTELEAARSGAGNELLALEGLDVSLHERNRVLGKQRSQGLAITLLADDRRASQQVPLTWPDPVEPICEQALQRGRPRVGRQVLMRCEQLLGIQRVALRRCNDVLDCPGRDRTGTHEDQLLDVLWRKRIEEEHDLALPFVPPGTAGSTNEDVTSVDARAH